MTAGHALVTGAAGLIGSHVARHLLELGWSVVGLDAMLAEGGANPHNLADLTGAFDFHEADCRDAAAVRQAIEGADVVFHLAARTSHVGSMTDPHSDLADNVEATINVLEAIRSSAPGAALILASTRQVFGRPRYLPVDMRHPVSPPDVNAINKLAAEEYLRLYNRIYRQRGLILRLTNIYGPGMRICDAKQNFLGVWLRACVTGSPLQIFGDGRQLRDFLYVEDVARLMVRAAGQLTDDVETFLVGGTGPIDLNQLAGILKRAAGEINIQRVPFEAARSRIDIGDFHGDISEVGLRFGWKPSVELEVGLTRSLDFYRRHRDAYLECGIR